MARAPVQAMSLGGTTTAAIVTPDYIAFEDASGNENAGFISYVFTVRCNGLTGELGNIRATWAVGAPLNTKRAAIRAALNAQFGPHNEPGLSLAESAIEVAGIPT